MARIRKLINRAHFLEIVILYPKKSASMKNAKDCKVSKSWKPTANISKPLRNHANETLLHVPSKHSESLLTPLLPALVDGTKFTSYNHTVSGVPRHAATGNHANRGGSSNSGRLSNPTADTIVRRTVNNQHTAIGWNAQYRTFLKFHFCGIKYKEPHVLTST